MKLTRPLAVIATTLLLASAASADVVASYTFVSSTAASAVNNTTNVDEINAGNFTVYVGNTIITTGNGGISGTSGGGAYLKANVDYATSESGAVTNGTYYSFTITPAQGTELQLTSLTFELGGSANSTGGFNVTAFLRTSLDSFAADTGTVTSGSLTYSVPNNNSANFDSLVTIDLSSLTSITAATTFEIYSYTSTNNASGVYARINDVTLNATATAIPEPATYALVFATCMGLLVLGFRWKKSRA